MPVFGNAGILAPLLQNRTLFFGDNLDILREKFPGEEYFDLIYLDPPFNSKRDYNVLFNYDLELPPDFRPVNADGEIAEFYLWPIERVIETVRNSGEFKFNCALVVIDFLVRHGLIFPDHPDYEEILRGLHG